jgi:hypothetical protein
VGSSPPFGAAYLSNNQFATPDLQAAKDLLDNLRIA